MLAQNFTEIDSRRAIKRVLDLHPTLNANGFGALEIGQPKSERERLEEIAAGRRELGKDWQQFLAAVSVLERLTKTACISWRAGGCYSLKHTFAPLMASRILGGYVTNGTFICAAIHCGFRLKIKGPNAWINVSSKSVESLLKQEVAA